MHTRTFEVTWRIDLSANTHEEAAEIAWERMVYSELSETILSVNDGVNMVRVDITQD